jgi:hypothetical protein
MQKSKNTAQQKYNIKRETKSERSYKLFRPVGRLRVGAIYRAPAFSIFNFQFAIIFLNITFPDGLNSRTIYGFPACGYFASMPSNHNTAWK